MARSYYERLEAEHDAAQSRSEALRRARALAAQIADEMPASLQDNFTLLRELLDRAASQVFEKVAE